MSVYAIAVFLHIVGALGLFAALGLEWASLYNLRRVTTIAALGGALTGRRSAAIARSAAGEAAAISVSLRQQLHDPVLLLSVWLRTALGLGVVFVMSLKPDAAGALTAMGVALVLGLAAGFPRRRPSNEA